MHVGTQHQRGVALEIAYLVRIFRRRHCADCTVPPLYTGARGGVVLENSCSKAIYMYLCNCTVDWRESPGAPSGARQNDLQRRSKWRAKWTAETRAPACVSQ